MYCISVYYVHKKIKKFTHLHLLHIIHFAVHFPLCVHANKLLQLKVFKHISNLKVVNCYIYIGVSRSPDVRLNITKTRSPNVSCDMLCQIYI